MAIGQAHDLEKISHCLVAFDFALGQGFHAVHEAVPLGNRNTQLLFDQLDVKAGAVRHFDRTAGTVQRDGQCVVAHDAHRGRCGCGGQGPIAGCCQQDVALDQVVAFE